MAHVADAVIVGAGIAGVATGFELAVTRGVGRAVIVDPRPPLTLTSDKSSECYRNFFPTKPMVDLANRSIDIFDAMQEKTGNIFNMSRRGYLFVTADERQLASLAASADLSSSFGAGPVRRHQLEGEVVEQDWGFDVFESSESLLARFPYLTAESVGGVHVRRGGWLSAQQLGAWMLESARDKGATLIRDEVVDIRTSSGRLDGVTLGSGERVDAPVVINAAGPMSQQIARLVEVDLPLKGSVHHKVSFKDSLSAFPRDAPFLVWTDPQKIDWTEDERKALANEGLDELLGEVKTPVFGRPEGGFESPFFEALWEYRTDLRDPPTMPFPDADEIFAEAVMRGMSTMLPCLSEYRDRLPYSVVDGGYVMKTPENLPLLGPAGPEGFHLVTAMSGYGVMISTGAAELVGAHVLGAELPAYSKAFLLSRYDDPEYLSSQNLIDTGELGKKGAQLQKQATTNTATS